MAFYPLINHEKRFIALCNPKCGSATAKHWFSVSIGSKETLCQPDLDTHRINTSMIADHPDYKTILFMRSSYDRLVSFYGSFIVR